MSLFESRYNAIDRVIAISAQNAMEMRAVRVMPQAAYRIIFAIDIQSITFMSEIACALEMIVRAIPDAIMNRPRVI